MKSQHTLFSALAAVERGDVDHAAREFRALADALAAGEAPPRLRRATSPVHRFEVPAYGDEVLVPAVSLEVGDRFRPLRPSSDGSGDTCGVDDLILTVTEKKPSGRVLAADADGGNPCDMGSAVRVAPVPA